MTKCNSSIEGQACMTRREALAVVSAGLFSVRRAQELKPSAGRTLEPPPAGVTGILKRLLALFGNQRARKVAVDVANIVLHRTARNRLGLIAHDDTADFAIPDVTFLAVSSLMIGAALDSNNATAYRNQALYELRTSIETFLIKDIGLAKTVYLNDGIGRTSWTRASGWLFWAITAMLGRLDAKHSPLTGCRSDLRTLAD